MTKAKQHQRAKPARALVARTGRSGTSSGARATRPPGLAGAPPPKAAPPIAAAEAANIIRPVSQTQAAKQAGEAGVGSGPGREGAGPGFAGVEGVGTLLGSRGVTHGDFAQHARVAQAIKAAYRASLNWASLSDGQKTALEANADKVARILSGDADHPDHWDDIAGYAVLAKSTPISGTRWRTVP